MTEQQWTNKAKSLLVGRMIRAVEYVSVEECENMGWSSRPLAIHLDDGTWILPMRDDEGNDGGAMATSDEELGTIPVLWT